MSVKCRHHHRAPVACRGSFKRQLVALFAAALVLVRFGLGVGQALAADALPADNRDDFLRVALEICTVGGVRTLPPASQGNGEDPTPDYTTPFCPACLHHAAGGAFAVLPEVPWVGHSGDIYRVERAASPVPLASRAGRASFRSRAPPICL